MKSKLLIVFTLALLLATGCANMNKNTKTQPSEDAQPEQQSSYEETYNNPNYYYDFDDVLIPRELTPVDEEKYVFSDHRFHAGFRQFSGRVVAEDLYNFFVNNMAKDNWKLKFSLKTVRSVLVFEKPNKSCTITIEDGFSTNVSVFAIELKTDGTVSSGVMSSDVPE